MKVTAVFFSPTCNTEKYVTEMVQVTGEMPEVINVTSRDSEERVFGPDELVVFGAPVHGGLIPEIAARRFSKFKGTRTPAVIVASYGNRHYDDALVQMQDILSAQGFLPQGAAAVIGRHTFGEIQTDRPNAADLEEARDFMKRLLASERKEEALALPGNRPYLAKGVKGRFRPQTKKELCVGCGMCVRDCPVGAIAEDCATISEECISCFRCIRHCPMKGKFADSDLYKQVAAMMTEKLSVPRPNEFYL